jgi:hypothetical protein
MRRVHAVGWLLVLVGVSATAGAAVTAVSLNAGAWEKTPYLGVNQTPNATVTNAAGGNLVGTKTTATGGTNASLGIHTIAAYNLQNATLRYQWKQNGLGQWSGHYNGVDAGTASLLYGVGYVTGIPYGSLKGITSNTWVYTQIVFSAGTYDWSVGTTAYGDTDIWHAAGALAPASWTALAAAHPFFQIGDNYAAGAYFEVAAVTITDATPSVVSVQSRKVHGGTGTFDLPLSP